jgi:hypothetical protein
VHGEAADYSVMVVGAFVVEKKPKFNLCGFM